MVVIRIQPLRAAEAGASAGGGVGAPRKPVKTGIIPEADAKLADLAVFAAEFWQTQPWLTLRFMLAPDFVTKAAAYKQSVADRVSAGAERPGSAVQIEDFDAQINEHLYRVKAMVTDKYDKKRAPAYFAKMGIAKEADSYILPRERSKRAAALQQLVNGLTDEGFVTQTLPGGTVVFPFGTAFWQPIATQYAQALKDLTTDTGEISDAVGEKNLLREEVEMVLRGLAEVLEGNYPTRRNTRPSCAPSATSARTIEVVPRWPLCPPPRRCRIGQPRGGRLAYVGWSVSSHASASPNPVNTLPRTPRLTAASSPSWLTASWSRRSSTKAMVRSRRPICSTSSPRNCPTSSTSSAVTLFWKCSCTSSRRARRDLTSKATSCQNAMLVSSESARPCTRANR